MTGVVSAASIAAAEIAAAQAAAAAAAAEASAAAVSSQLVAGGMSQAMADSMAASIVANSTAMEAGAGVAAEGAGAAAGSGAGATAGDGIAEAVNTAGQVSPAAEASAPAANPNAAFGDTLLGQGEATGVSNGANGAAVNASGTGETAGVNSSAAGTNGTGFGSTADTSASGYSPGEQVVGPQTGTEMSSGAQASGSYTQPVNGMTSPSAAPNTTFGLTDAQWAQQALSTGLSSGMNAYANGQARGAQSRSRDGYMEEAAAMDAENQRRIQESLAAYSPEKLQANQDAYVNTQMADYDQNRMAPETGSFGSISADDEVQSDMDSKRAQVQAYNRNQFLNGTKLRSYGQALLGANQNMGYNAEKNQLNNSIAGLLSGAAGLGQQSAAHAGDAAKGASSLVSGLGNLALANQLTTGKKPSSVFDV